MSAAGLAAIMDAYPRLRIAVVGDFCLDRYLEIDPAKREVSIETGLPVYNVVRVRAQPGAAGTVLNNLAALGVGTLIPVGWCGDDGEGFELRRALAALPGVRLTHFASTPARRTFTYCKPLVLEPGQPPVELNRLDSKNWDPTPESLQEQLAESLEKLAPDVDAIIVMDQVEVPETGVVTSRILELLGRLQAARPELRIIGDSRRGLSAWPPITYKMNAAELASLSGRTGQAALDEVERTAYELATRNGHDVFITLAAQGMLAASPDGGVIHVPALPVRGPIDVVGAGDSVTANLTAALAAGASLLESLTLAATASSIVIHKLGTTGTASRDEIAALVAVDGVAEFVRDADV